VAVIGQPIQKCRSQLGIAEHVWLLEKTNADHKFLVFGNDRRLPEEWLKRYSNLVEDVSLYFLTNDGTVKQLL